MTRDRKRNPNIVGAVMVVGGGIAGMQASLDLAEAGYKVYLVEKKPAIGGHMAQLDKTFPTNDCAMCTISPKLVDCGRHRNIELLVDTDVLDVDGTAGNFTARVRTRPRYIDLEKCTGCGDCGEVCPVPMPNLFEEGQSTQKAAYKLYPQAVPNAFGIEKRGIAPCRDACPIHQRAQGYVALVREGRFAEAYRAIKKDNPFPAVCGRVCNHVCETACSRGKVDEAVSIMRLKRFVADWAFEHPEEVAEALRPRIASEAETQEVRPTGKKVAIVGSGPAGLTVAQDLTLKGHETTVFEALPVAGGMMRVGIPAYRLPYDLLQREIDEIIDLGVRLRLNTRVDDVVALKEDANHGPFDAVFVGIGAHAETPLRIPATDVPQYLSAVDFLRDASMERYPDLAGKTVIVLGGGDVAMDAACTAMRIGTMQADQDGGDPPQVRVAYRRTEAEMPAQEMEVRQAKEDGVTFDWLVSPVEVMPDEEGGVCGLSCRRMELGEPDESGRRRPVPIEGSEFLMDADVIISAIGARPDLTCVPESIECTPRGLIAVDDNTMMTSVDGIFAAGDAVTGMAFVVDAIAAGHRAAQAMDAYLRGEPMPGPEPELPVAELTEADIEAMRVAGQIVETARACTLEVSPGERVHSLGEVCGPMTAEEAITEATRCLQCGVCSECLSCWYACQADAIDHDMVEQVREIEVGAVVLAPGYEIFQAERAQEYGWGRYPNVVTALQLERLMSASGPTQGHVLRPSDGEKPRKIAFLQCVGSRDAEHDYCSAVCCMYATKEPIMIKEHEPDTEISVFMMDMRAFSKGYYEYYRRAEDRYGVRYVRSRVSVLREDPETQDLVVRYVSEEDGRVVEEEFGLVVLSVGMEISDDVREMARRLNVSVDKYGFCHTDLFEPLETGRPGIYAVGPFREPKDIPESVIEGTGAAAAAGVVLAPARWTRTEEVTYPPERDISREEARIGVFVCHCGSNIGGYLDVPQVAHYAASLPGVVHAEHNLYTCSQDSIKRITEQTKEHNLNRVVVASCTPLTHEPLFQDSIRQAGLNPGMFHMANIRNQCSWVHSNCWEESTEKAKDLVRMAVAKAAQLAPIHMTEIPVEKAVVVIGGGIAGMTAALTLAEQGFPVHLIERAEQLGGNLWEIQQAATWDTEQGKLIWRDVQPFLKDTIRRVERHRQITVHLQSELLETGGFAGNFTSRIGAPDGETKVRHGATILATGGVEYKGPEYGYGTDSRIVTQHEFEAQLGEGKSIPSSVVMIQCVGPAERYCSRICCTSAMKNSLKLKELNPDAQVTVLYTDVRTYGFKERLYQEARRQGVLFVPYKFDRKPQVEIGDSRLQITVWEPSLGEDLVLNPDLLVLSMPVVPPDGAEELATRLKVPQDMDGFFLEAHVKLRPVDFASDGLFMAGMAHYPKFLDETIAQAQAAAARAATIVSRDVLEVGGIIAQVDVEKCVGCLTCVRVCPYNVPQIRAEFTGVGGTVGAAYVEPAQCHGCGICVSECPAKAIQLMHYEDAQIGAEIEVLLEQAPVEVCE